MTAQECTAPHCEKHLAEGVYLCDDDLTKLKDALLDVRDTLAALGAVAIRSTAYGESVGGASAGDKPVMFDEVALTRGYELRELVNAWARYILEPLTAQWDRDTLAWMEECERIDALALTGGPAPPMPAEPLRPGPRDHRSPATVAEWVATMAATIRVSEWAGDMYDEIIPAVRQCLRGADRPVQRVFAGMCPTDIEGEVCGSPLYALQGKPYVTCRTCGEAYDVNGWRAAALAAAGIIEGTAAEISRALTDPTTGEALPAATIRKWAQRKQLIRCNGPEILQAVGSRQLVIPQKRYRISEVQELWLRMKASKYGNPALKNSPVGVSVVS
ncbi:hypothetical protein [Arthrobacter agilis]|uniref:hypothetical protein n=1 Tax=Arthrobacter agilis TaxID=37921 RepID=UPI002783BF96|nr:hypothetical protein [Arthrobacter agilis]MDQ0735162.1 hypothetical protein [Arthrobacter agilis]